MLKFKRMPLKTQYAFYSLLTSKGIEVSLTEKSIRRNIDKYIEEHGEHSIDDIVLFMIERNYDQIFEDVTRRLAKPKFRKRSNKDMSAIETFKEMADRFKKYHHIMNDLTPEDILEISKRYSKLYTDFWKVPFTDIDKDAKCIVSKYLAEAIHIMAVEYSINCLAGIDFLELKEIVSAASSREEAEYQDAMKQIHGE